MASTKSGKVKVEKPAKKERGEWSPDKVREIGEFALTKSTDFRVVINSFDDREKHYVDLRQWYEKKGEDDKLPGKGISVEVQHLDAVIGLLKKAKARAIKAKLIPEG